MLSTSILPLEIQETILNFLAKEDDAQSELKLCSFVCHAFLAICRKHIFRSIRVVTDFDSNGAGTLVSLERLLCKRPEIADHIRQLDFTIQRRADRLTSPSIQAPFKRITRLESLTVQHDLHSWPRFDWSGNSAIRPALLYLLQLPTLTHFKVSEIDNFSVSDLLPCVNLKYLNVGSQTTRTVTVQETMFPVAAFPDRPIGLNEIVAERSTAPMITKLCAARFPDGRPLIDFRCLTKITMVFVQPSDGEVSQELFRHCENLTNVHLSFLTPKDIRPSLSDMLLSSIQSLKHIFVMVQVDDVNVDPLFGVPSELEDMRTKNIIESVAIEVVVQTDADCHEGDDWGRLDKVLTTPGWFSELKRFSLVIQIASFSRTDVRLEVALRKLPESQFPRLSSSNSISFNFEVIPILI